MNKVCITAAALAVLVTPAFSQSKNVREGFAQALPSRHTVSPAGKIRAAGNDVIVNGRVIGRDPSDYVRTSMVGDDSSLGAGGEGGGGNAE